MEEYTKVSRSPTPQLNELIKLDIGTRSLSKLKRNPEYIVDILR